MDHLTIVGYTLIGFLLFLLATFWLGLKGRVPSHNPIVSNAEIEKIQLPAHLPEPVKKHYFSVYESEWIPLVKTAVVWGKAQYKISNLWMSSRYINYMESGHRYLKELEFFWYGKTFLKGVDFFIGGIGAIQVNGVMRMNESGRRITESQWIGFWAESFLTGTMVVTDDRLKWEILSERKVRVQLPAMPHAEAADTSASLLSLDLFFSHETGRLTSIQALRYRGQLEDKRIEWQCRVKSWRKTDLIWLPKYAIRWMDQKKPWCHYEPEGLAVNVPVDEPLKRIKPKTYAAESLHRRSRKRSAASKMS